MISVRCGGEEEFEPLTPDSKLAALPEISIQSAIFPCVTGEAKKRCLLAPGLKLPPCQLNQVRHHHVLGHGLAVQAIRACGRSGTKIGPAEHLISTAPIIETPENIKGRRERYAGVQCGLHDRDGGGQVH